MRQIIIDAIKEEIDASIDATDLNKLPIDGEERRRLKNEVDYMSKSYRNGQINDLLLDYSPRDDLKEEEILALLENTQFYRQLIERKAPYIIRPIFKYLLDSDKNEIVNKSVSLYFEKYKKCFKTINFEESTQIGYKPKIGILEYLTNLENMNKGLGDKFVKQVDHNDVYRLGGYQFTTKFYSKAYGKIEREYMQSGCKDLKDFLPLIDEYTYRDVSGSNFVYGYNQLVKELNKNQSDSIKEEIELIIETINSLGRLNTDNEQKDIKTTSETLNRIFTRCDTAGVELSDEAINRLAYEVLKEDKKYQQFKESISHLYSIYTKTNYDSNLQDFVDMVNRDYNYDFSGLFGGRTGKELTVEMLESFVRDNQVYFIKQLGEHESTKEYINQQEMGIDVTTGLNKEVSTEKRDTLEKYKNRLKVLKKMKNLTIEYYVHMNIPEEDQEEFMNLFNYWCRTEELDREQFSSPEAKRGVYEIIEADMNAEIETSDYNEADNIIRRYIEWLNVFNSFKSQDKIRQLKKSAQPSRVKAAERVLDKNFKKIVKAYQEKENLYLFFKELNVNVDALNECLKYANSKYQKYKEELKKIITRYATDREKYEEEVRKQEELKRKQEKDQQRQILIVKFINSNCKTIKEFTDSNKMTLKSFEYAVNYIKENSPKLYNSYLEKLEEQKTKKPSPEMVNAFKILELVQNGIEEENDVREFDYLDFRLMTRMTHDEFSAFIKRQNIDYTPALIKKLMQSKPGNGEPNRITEEQIYSEQNKINGKIIPLSVKKAVVAYLKDHQIEEDNRAYRIALKRFLDKKLDLSKYLKEEFDLLEETEKRHK